VGLAIGECVIKLTRSPPSYNSHNGVCDKTKIELVTAG